jgi:NOL1/NOP2/fmu family ribosome biogenesis protein
MTRHVVMMSGGTGSWAAARRVADRHGTADLILLFADTNSEDEDLYRFLREAHADVGGQLVTLDNDGKTIWDVFREHRYLGNTRIDPCSYYLKRLPMRRWLEANCDPADTVCHLGIDWSESHRYEKARKYWEPWRIEAPMCEAPYLDKDQIGASLAERGIEVPLLNRQGFAHNNCGGGCVKAGQGQFKQLLELRPDTFAEWEQGEAVVREQLGNVAILRDRRGGKTKPLPLSVLRANVQDVDEFDFGGCACAVGSLEDDAATLAAMTERGTA